jgi:hypothetical protein
MSDINHGPSCSLWESCPYGRSHLWLPLTDPGRWSGAAGAVLGSAFVSGTIGGLIVRRHAVIGGMVSLLLAWLVAIAALPVLPGLFQLDVAFQYFCECIARAAALSSDPTSGLRLLAQAPFALPLSPYYEPVPFVSLAVGVVAWARLLRWSSGGGASGR